MEKIRKNNSINLIGDPKKKASVISFTLKGVHPHDIATILDDDGVAIRAGHHCCQILHEKIESFVQCVVWRPIAGPMSRWFIFVRF